MLSLIALDVVSDDGDVVVLGERDERAADGRDLVLRYRTRTGALLRIGGVVRGAFDREHATIDVPESIPGRIELEVERPRVTDHRPAVG